MARYAPLAQAVRPAVVAKYAGELLLSLAAMTTVPLVAALLFREWNFAVRLGTALAVLLAIGIPTLRLPAPKRIEANEGMVIIALLFVVAALVVTWPLAAAGLAWHDALFEAVSAVTTTGLSTVADIERQTPAFLFFRAWLQWYWGLVIVVLALALVLEPGAVAKRLAASEAGTEDIVGSTRTRAVRSLSVYALLTVVGILGLWLLGVPVFQAVLYALSAVSTGGFAPDGRSLQALDGFAPRAAVMVLCVLAAISFSVYERARRHGIRAIGEDVEVRTLFAAMAVTTLLFAATRLMAGGVTWQALLDGSLTAISAQSTAGFSSVAVGDLDPASKLVLVVSMLLGGDAGSTAGGIKIIRFLVVVRLFQLIFLRARLPRHAVISVDVQGRRLDDEQIHLGLAIVFLYLMTILVGWMIFLVAGHDAFNALFDVVSTVTTTGLSTGVVGPDLDPALKLLLCAGMLLGRLEVCAVLVLVYPGTWIGRRPVSE